MTTIRLPIDIWPGNFWAIIAKEKGFFEEEGLNAELIDVSNNYNKSVEEFISGSADLLDTHLIAVFDLVEANIDGGSLVAVLVSDNSEGAEGLVAKKEYNELPDLIGKRIGIEVGSYLDYYLEAAMLNAGIENDEYIKVDIVSEELPSVFHEANLEAAFSWEPDLTDMKEEYNLKTIFDTSDIRGLSPGIFVFKKEFIEARPGDVQAFMNTWNKATEYILNNKEEAYDIVSQIDFADEPGVYYSAEEIKDLFELDPILDRKANIKSFSFDAGFESLYGNIQFVSRFIQQKQELDKTPNTNQMLNNQFLRNISQ